jgi:quercetin dioxygenase-like cupin family protein
MAKASPGCCALGGAAAIALLGAAAAAAGEPEKVAQSTPRSRLQPAEISWPSSSAEKVAGSSMQAAVESVVVFGDASKPGLYSIMFRVQPGARIPAHSHPDDRSCFVVSGVWFFGYGDRFSEEALRALPAGSHYTEPANVNHFAATRRESAIAECTSIGPTATTFAERADDPRP